MDTISFLAPPLTASIILVGILSYFGNHILTRGVIFVDIAVAQVAALGTMIGILLGASEGSFASSAVSLIFTLLVVSVFAISKFQHKELSQEVIIGIIYCMALALAYLLIDRVPGGSNFVQKTFTGAILWVTWSDILHISILFFIVGLIQFFLLKKTIMISEGRGKELGSTSHKFIDIIFYISFGFIVVQAVKIGGIFVVFMFLIGPAATAVLLSSKWFMRFLLSFVIGILASIIGILVSYNYNFPNGPTIVCLLGIFLVLTAILSKKRLPRI